MGKSVESRQDGVDLLQKPPEGTVEAFLQDGYLSDERFEQLMTDFPSAAAEILNSQDVSPALREMLKFGLTYHQKGVRQALIGVNGYAPGIRVDYHESPSPHWSEKLEGLIGVKYVEAANGQRERRFLGVATRGSTHILVDIKPLGEDLAMKGVLSTSYNGGPSNVNELMIEGFVRPQYLKKESSVPVE